MIIVTGSIAYDYIMEFPGQFGDHILPEQIYNVNLSFIVNKFAKRRGGTAGNVSYTMGLLKTPHILFSYAGNDFGVYKKQFKKLGIDTNHVLIDKTQHTSTGFAMTDKSNNQIWGYYYGAASNNPKLSISSVARKGDLVLIGPQGAQGSMSLIHQCAKQNIPYMFDPGFILTQVTDEDLTIGLTHATYVIGNEYEITLIKQRIPRWQNIAKNKIIIETLGEKGTVIKNTDKTYIIKPAAVSIVASTTGAGDAWRGGFLAGLERGFDLQACGQMGAVAASYAIEQYGTQEHTYTVDEFQKRYRQNFGSLVEL